MNKYKLEQSLYLLEKVRQHLPFAEHYKINVIVNNIKELQQLVELHTPKKVPEMQNGYDLTKYGCCPNCNSFSSVSEEYEGITYCQDCGQALDWSEQ